MKVFNVVNYTSNLLASILSLIIGVILFNRPDLVIILISYVLGGLLIFWGILKIIYYSYNKGKDNNYPLNDLIWALICIIIGLICIFLSSAIEQAVRFVIGSWILLIGINRFIKALQMPNKKESKFITVLIVSILLMLVGLYVILVSNLIISYLGIVLIIYSVLEIVNYILLFKDTNYAVYEEKTKDKDIKVIETKEKKK